MVAPDLTSEDKYLSLDKVLGAASFTQVVVRPDTFLCYSMVFNLGEPLSATSEV